LQSVMVEHGCQVFATAVLRAICNQDMERLEDTKEGLRKLEFAQTFELEYCALVLGLIGYKSLELMNAFTHENAAAS